MALILRHSRSCSYTNEIFTPLCYNYQCLLLSPAGAAHPAICAGFNHLLPIFRCPLGHVHCPSSLQGLTRTAAEKQSQGIACLTVLCLTGRTNPDLLGPSWDPENLGGKQRELRATLRKRHQERERFPVFPQLQRSLAHALRHYKICKYLKIE